MKNAEISERSVHQAMSRATTEAAARTSMFAPIGFKFKYCSNAKLAERARSVDRALVCLNAVTNRKYIIGDKGVIRMNFRHAGKGMNAMLAVSAAPIVTLDLVEGLFAAGFSGQEFSRRHGNAAPHETQLVSGEFLNDAPSGSFAAFGALSLSDVAGQREYHAEF